MTDALSQWKEFLNPQTLQRRMLSAAVFLVAHEMLIASVKTRLRDFFTIGFDGKGPVYSPSYEEKVLQLDPKGKRDPWRASIAWLEAMSVIDHDDRAKIKEFTDARNIFAHELQAIVTGSKSPDFEALFPALVDMIIKIDRWWIVNFEIETDPDLTDKEVDHDKILTGSQIMLSIIHQAALGNISEAQDLYEEFVAGLANG
ncbi:MAG: hypothetical protein RSE12_17520 [Fuscovulum sp.]|nr:MAG: hypothetical protein RSE12_17520 [Fuscovulum sp.]